MKTGKSKVLKAAICILGIFLAFNVFWYIWRNVKYGPYIKGMRESEIPDWIVPRYYYVDDEGYDYSVKYPDYLSFTGNMSVGLPSADGNPFTDFLIIWPKLDGRYEYGVSLTVEGTNYQIMINDDGSAIDSKFSGIVASCKETIDILLLKGDKMWHLE